MSPFAILSILLGVVCAGVFIAHFILKAAKIQRFLLLGLSVAYIAFLICLVLWCRKTYENDNQSLATWTFLVGGLMLGTLFFAPFVYKYKIPTYILMVAFLLFGVALVIMGVYLSKSILQPGATLLGLF